MGGKVWSRDEESAFWTVIIPSSNKRLLMDRPSALNPRAWTQLAATMQNMMGVMARRQYTPLMLYEHFFQNAVLENFSPSARSFAQAYINEEQRATGLKPSERSRNLVRSTPSETRASRRRALVSATSAPSTSTETQCGLPLPAPPGPPNYETPDELLDEDIPLPADGQSLLSPELEEEVSRHLQATSALFDGPFPLEPNGDMYESRYFGHTQYATGTYDRYAGIPVYPSPLEPMRLPSMFAGPTGQPADMYARHERQPSLPPLSAVISFAASLPADEGGWLFPPAPRMAAAGRMTPEDEVEDEVEEEVEAEAEVEAKTETADWSHGYHGASTFDESFRLNQLATLAASESTPRDAPVLTAPPSSPVSPASSVSPTSSIASEPGPSTPKPASSTPTLPAPARPPTPAESHCHFDQALTSPPPEQQPGEQDEASRKTPPRSSEQDGQLFVPQWE